MVSHLIVAVCFFATVVYSHAPRTRRRDFLYRKKVNAAIG